MRDPDKAPPTEAALTPAECAKRTGLTVRALHVYERYGLVSAKRTANRWRFYGLEELERLNTIAVLKSLGMTLTQIRDLIHAENPSLERVLEMQVRAWKAKKLESERGLLLAQWAFRRVKDRHSLSVDAMCNLIRGMEFSDHTVLIHGLLSETLTPDEFKSVMDFLKTHFDLAQVKLQLQQEAAIFMELRHLMDQGIAPESDAVQQLLVKRNELVSRYGGQERALKTIEWNPIIGIKFFSIEARTLKRMRAQPEAEHDPRVIVTPKLSEFFQEANRRAPWTNPIVEIVADAKALLQKDPDPGSVEAKELVARFRNVYSQYGLGDPEVAAKLVRYWEALNGEWPQSAGEENQAAWLFLSDAVTRRVPPPADPVNEKMT
jgi:DNA-binding transcriptional MerR regulator